LHCLFPCWDSRGDFIAPSFFHGIRISNESKLPNPIQSASSSVIAIVAPAEGLTTEPVLIRKRKDTEKITGLLKRCLDAIFLQTEAQVVIISCKDGEETQAIQRLKEIESSLGVKPTILLCPKIWDKDAAKYEMIKTELVAISKKLSAVSILDLPQSATKSIFPASERVLGCYPHVKAADGENTPYSAFLAGVIAKTDEEKGFWHSPSNQTVNGISALSVPVDYSDDDECLANQLNRNKIVTIIRPSNEFRVWGNSGGYSEDKKEFRFISVLRTHDVINESLKASLRWAIDQGITRNLLEQIQASVNTFLSSLRKKGAIIDGYCWPDDEENSDEEIMQGRVHFQFKWTPVFIAESINFKSVLTAEYLKKIRG
jgi:hypothetical protein